MFVFASKPERAVGHFEAAIRLNPHHPAGYLQGLGIAYFAMDDLEQAAALFERALQRNPDLWYSTGFLAASYGHLGRDEEATAALQMWLAQALAAVGYIPDDAFAGTWGSPFADGIVENRWRNGLRKAGLEE